jgi:hypothetical protein
MIRLIMNSITLLWNLLRCKIHIMHMMLGNIKSKWLIILCFCWLTHSLLLRHLWFLLCLFLNLWLPWKEKRTYSLWLQSWRALIFYSTSSDSWIEESWRLILERPTFNRVFHHHILKEVFYLINSSII